MIPRINNAICLLDCYNNQKIKKKISLMNTYLYLNNIIMPRTFVYSGLLENIPEYLKIVYGFQNASFFIVWAGILHTKRLSIVFINKGIQININFYHSDTLQVQQKPKTDKLYLQGDKKKRRQNLMS